MALFSLFFSIAVPNFKIYREIQEKTELNTLKKDLRFFRNRAILESKNYSVIFDEEKNSYTVHRGLVGMNPIKKVQFKNGIKVANRDGSIIFVFKANGTVGESNTVNLKNSKDERLTLTLTPVTGKVSIEKE